MGSNNTIQKAAVQYVIDSILPALERNPDRKFVCVPLLCRLVLLLLFNLIVSDIVVTAALVRATPLALVKVVVIDQVWGASVLSAVVA